MTVSKDDLDAIEYEVKHLAYKIIDYKKETSYGVANCLLKITKAILNDESIVLNISSPVDGIYIGLPSVINKDGNIGTMKVSLSEDEKEKFEHSKDVIKTTIKNMEV